MIQVLGQWIEFSSFFKVPCQLSSWHIFVFAKKGKKGYGFFTFISRFTIQLLFQIFSSWGGILPTKYNAQSAKAQ